MFERLTNDDIKIALDELVVCFGVKADMPIDDLVAVLRNATPEACVQEISSRLGLPVKIRLSYVTRDNRSSEANRFRSSAVSETDWTGRGINGIIAQVSIPQHLPLYGTSALQGYPIQVRVSEDCRAHPDSFIAIMAHELSHVLLAAVWSPHKDSELHTDLVPILLGFREAVKRGRKRIQSTTSGRTTTTRTTTYGYLSDEQFQDACTHVTAILKGHQPAKERLTELITRAKRDLSSATRCFNAYRDYFAYLDAHPPATMRREHAERVVQLHTHDYCREWQHHIAALTRSLAGAELFVRNLDHYTANTLEKLNTHTRSLDLCAARVREAAAEIATDERILRRYVSLTQRLRSALRYHS